MIKEINVKKHKEYAGHEKVFQFEDKKTGLRGYLAWHSTTTGPVTGGTRLFPYKKAKDALSDVLRLSRAMSYKCAFSGVPFGGSKTTIIASQKQKTKELLESYAHVIDSFHGLCTTGTDVGISDDDAKFMSSITPHILKGTYGRTTTSLMATRGIYEALIVAVKEIIPKKKWSEVTVAIKGVGKIGAELVRLLTKKGAKIIIADKDEGLVKKIKKQFPKVKVVDYKTIHKSKVDVYAPCALSGEFNKKTIKELNCQIIVGGANNQFSNEKDISEMMKRGIWYIPDYVVNSGGLIQITDELQEGGYSKKRVMQRIKNIGKNVSHLIRQSKVSGMSTLEIANTISHKKIYPNERK